jgi:hypothetical protein
MLRGWIVVVLSVLALAACAQESKPSAGSRTDQQTGEKDGETAEKAAIVGRWKQVHTCDQLVDVLESNGLAQVAPATVLDYFPDSSPSEVARKPDICKGARPQAHYHFFNEFDSFGSLDQDGNQVDDGTYKLINHRTFRIGKARFRYRIEQDRTLVLHPVITAPDRRRALAHPLQFSTAGWQVAVSYDGRPWKRVNCSGWC